MNMHEKEVIARTMVREEFKAGDFIVRQGEVGNSFYIILNGTLDVITHDVHPGKPFRPEKMSDSSARRVARLESGQWFGRQAWCEVCQGLQVSVHQRLRLA